MRFFIAIHYNGGTGITPDLSTGGRAVDIINHILTIASFIILCAMFLGPLAFTAWLYLHNRRQTQSSLLRGKHWFLGILRYIIEKIGPELRFYITDDDNAGKPISRVKFIAIVKAAKYLNTLISYGSKRDFAAPGLYLRNTLFPPLNGEMAVDQPTSIPTRKYVIERDTLFMRFEKVRDEKVRPWLLADEHAITVGPTAKKPWRLKGLVGSSGMSYGALGPNAVSALSRGIGMAGGSWMNTGEGGLSPYHLLGGGDLMFQIGAGLFGVRDKRGQMDWELLREKARIPQIRAIEIKLMQGAKIRGGHVEASKVTPEIAAIRNVEPYKSIDSPNRIPGVDTMPQLFDFIERVRETSGLPVGVKLVIGGRDGLEEFCAEFRHRGTGPDFITVDGAEGGSGATFKEMADSLGLPIYSAIVIADDTLRAHGLRDKVKLIASGRLHLPDEQAIALALGADLIAAARGFMITLGCIMAEKCHSNECPVGVATTDPAMQRALFVEEKMYRVVNYLVTVRAGLFSTAAACGLTSPTQFTRSHVVFKDADYTVRGCADLFPRPPIR